MVITQIFVQLTMTPSCIELGTCWLRSLAVAVEAMGESLLFDLHQKTSGIKIDQTEIECPTLNAGAACEIDAYVPFSKPTLAAWTRLVLHRRFRTVGII